MLHPNTFRVARQGATSEASRQKGVAPVVGGEGWPNHASLPGPRQNSEWTKRGLVALRAVRPRQEVEAVLSLPESKAASDAVMGLRGGDRNVG